MVFVKMEKVSAPRRRASYSPGGWIVAGSFLLMAAGSAHTHIIPALTPDFEGQTVCQLLIEDGEPSPMGLIASDNATGKVLIELKKGDEIDDALCVNAPDGHDLKVEYVPAPDEAGI